MSIHRKPPHDCADMGELRQSIDDLDRELVTLFTQRAAYIDRAAELKLINGWPARIPERVTQVIENAKQHAGEQGLDPELIGQIWTQLVEWSIAREDKVFENARTGD